MTMNETCTKLNKAQTYIEKLKISLDGILDESNRRKNGLTNWCNDWLVDCDPVKVQYTINNIYNSLLTIYLSKCTPEQKEIVTSMMNDYNIINLDITEKTFLNLCSLYSKIINDFKNMNIKDISKINQSFKAQLSVLKEDLDPLAIKLFYNYFEFNKSNKPPKSSDINSMIKSTSYSDDGCGHSYRSSIGRC